MSVGRQGAIKAMKDLIESMITKGAKIQIVEETHKAMIIEINVKAKPGAKIEKMEIGQEGEFIFSIRAKPVDGEANAALVMAVSELFKTSKSNVELVQGMKSRFKKMRVLLKN